MTKQQFIETYSKFLEHKSVRCIPVRIRLQLIGIYNECHDEKLINTVASHEKAYEWIRSLHAAPAETPSDPEVVEIRQVITDESTIVPEVKAPAETTSEEKPKAKRTRKPKTE